MADPLARTDADLQQRAAAGPPSAGQSLSDLGNMVLPYLAGAAPGGSLSSGIRLPKGLFDYSDLSKVPDVPQAALDRSGIPTWAKGVPERWQQLESDPSVFDRYKQAADVGLQRGGNEWYNTTPLSRAWMDVGGDQAGFRRYIDYVGASSPGNPVPQNIKSASWLYHADQQGLPLPELYEGGIYPPDVKARLWPKDAAGNEIPSGLSKTDTAALKSQFGLPPGYGGLTQGDWIGLADDIRSGRGFDLANNPKPPSFVQNLLGNYEPVTIDRHNMRLVAPFGGDVPGKAYPLLENLQQGYAAKLGEGGIAPAQAQASTWLGGGTGVKSSLEMPFVGEFEQKLN
jgi:hypothetical protein